MGADDVDIVIEGLKKEGLQSDHRFTEAYVNSRFQRGHGPVRISQELKEKGISATLADEIMEEYDDAWMQQLVNTREKKFGNTLPKDYKEQARQSHFLRYRGFNPDQIRKLFKKNDE
jgi:regulatory protein